MRLMALSRWRNLNQLMNNKVKYPVSVVCKVNRAKLVIGGKVISLVKALHKLPYIIIVAVSSFL